MSLARLGRQDDPWRANLRINGQFTLGYCRPLRRGPGGRFAAAVASATQQPTAAAPEGAVAPAILADPSEAPQGPTPLDLTYAANSHKAPRGQTGLTRHGRRRVREAAWALENVFGRQNLALGTATLPELTDSQWGALCDGWVEVVRQFYQGLDREHRRWGVHLGRVGVVELQSRRGQKTGRFYPHLHFVYVCRLPGMAKGTWLIDTARLRLLWFRAVNSVMPDGEKIGYARFLGSMDTHVVRKSAGAYISKYMTKGNPVGGEGPEVALPGGSDEPEHRPYPRIACWYALQNKMRNLLDQCANRSRYAAAQLLEFIHAGDPHIRHVWPVFLRPSDDTDTVTGELVRPPSHIPVLLGYSGLLAPTADARTFFGLNWTLHNVLSPGMWDASVVAGFIEGA